MSAIIFLFFTLASFGQELASQSKFRVLIWNEVHLSHPRVECDGVVLGTIGRNEYMIAELPETEGHRHRCVIYWHKSRSPRMFISVPGETTYLRFSVWSGSGFEEVGEEDWKLKLTEKKLRLVQPQIKPR